MIRRLGVFVVFAVLVGACQGGGDAPQLEVEAMMDAGTAAVDFETSCAPKVQEDFDTAVALLHNMTYHVAEARFGEIAAADPDCGMAYWGMAMSYIHPLWFEDVDEAGMARGAELVTKARATDLTAREAAYVDAVAAFYDLTGAPLFDRLDAFAAGFEALHAAYPDDPEAGALFALTHLVKQRPGTVNMEVVDRSTAASFAVLEQSPDHPGAHHYIIHAYDTPDLAPRAEDVARSYAGIVPDNPHALHMPTHIFTRLGLWKDSIELNIRSAEVALTMPFGDAVSVHYPHALDYLLFAYLQTGQESLAEQALDDLTAIQMPIEVSPASAYHLASGEARWALERHQWADAARVQPRQPADYPWDNFPQFEALAQYAVALGAARAGDTEAAQSGVARLLELEEATGHAYWKGQTQVMRVASEGWLAQARGDSDRAVELLREATDLEASMTKHPVTPGEVLPANELLGDLMRELGRHEEAIEAYEISLARTPNRFNSLYGAGRAAEAGGDAEMARDYYGRLAELCDRADTDRAELAHARAFLEG